MINILCQYFLRTVYFDNKSSISLNDFLQFHVWFRIWEYNYRVYQKIFFDFFHYSLSEVIWCRETSILHRNRQYPSQKYVGASLSAIDGSKKFKNSPNLFDYTITNFLKQGLKFFDTAQENQNKNFCEGQKFRISVRYRNF